MWTSVWKNCCTFKNHFVRVFISVVAGLCKDWHWFCGNFCAVFFSNNFAHHHFFGFCYSVEDSLCYAVTDSCVKSFTVNFDSFNVSGEVSEAVCFFAYEEWFDVFFDNWDEVFSKEEWVTSACTRVLYSCAIAECNLSVFKNEHYRNRFTHLSY